MRKTEYASEFGVTVGCVMKGAKHVEEFAENTHLPGRGPRLFCGDSRFGSVNTACKVRILGHHACFAIKTVHSRAPKIFLEETMKDFPGGTWIVMKGCAEKEDIPLICIGYKNNLKKVLVLPYLAKFLTNLTMCAQEKLRGQTPYQIISINQTWWIYIIKHDR